MQLSVLFWFYKDFEICVNRLKILKIYNPNIKVYALFGGDLNKITQAKAAIEHLIDDFYVFPYKKDSFWKWKHGDQMIAHWYLERGNTLVWDSLFIMQWDMLVFAPLEKIFHMLKPGQILISGTRPFKEVQSFWNYADPTTNHLKSFRRYLKTKFSYVGPLFASEFIVACLPRIFLDKYSDIGHPEDGFLEYKLPTLAYIFGIPFCDTRDFSPYWPKENKKERWYWYRWSLNPFGRQVFLSKILKELYHKSGKRIFHPYYIEFPEFLCSWHKSRIIYLLSYLLTPIDLASYYFGRIKKKMHR